MFTVLHAPSQVSGSGGYNRAVVAPKQDQSVGDSKVADVRAESGRATPESVFSLRQRLAIWFISHLATLAIRVIGVTLRVTTEAEPGSAPGGIAAPGVYSFWHECIFSATYIHRNRAISVMTSRSFDGEYIARIIESLGFRAVRGSSSRGGVGALLGMHQAVEEGRIAAFTIDGPRGPRHVAKPGPVLLARNTGVPLICFHVAHASAWTLNTWDSMRIPKPFSRAHVIYSRIIAVPRDADDSTMEQIHAEMQATLERVREAAEGKFAR